MFVEVPGQWFASRSTVPFQKGKVGILKRVEGPVDRGKAQIGNLVEFAQRAQDRQRQTDLLGDLLRTHRQALVIDRA